MTEILLPALAFAAAMGLLGALVTRNMTTKGQTYIWKEDRERREMVPDEPVKAGHCKNHPE